MNSSSSDDGELQRKAIALGFSGSLAEGSERAHVHASRWLAVAAAASLIFATCFALIVGWNVGHGPFGATQAGSVYSDPFVVCLFPYGELVYALSSLTRAWVSLFLGVVMGDLAASAVVGVIAFPVGFFYGAVASAATWGVAKLARSLRSSRAAVLRCAGWRQHHHGRSIQ